MIEKSPYEILVRPVISEKALNVSATPGGAQYVFRVAIASNKRQIRWAVEAAYGVKVTKVTTVLTKGKSRRSRNRQGLTGKRPDVKKAYVTLANGQQIALM